MAQKRGLGKGLDSLIAPKAPSQTASDAGQAAGAAAAGSGITEVPVGSVEPNRSQPRKKFDEASLRELADSIAQHGVLQPLLVRRADNYYEIIAGERRWRAARLAGLKTVPVIIKDVNDRERSEMALIENLQREDLDPVEEALAYRSLIDEYQLTQEDVAQRVSRSRTAVTNSLRLLKLDPRVQEMLVSRQISAGHARALLAVTKKEQQYVLAQQIAEKGLSVRDAEKLVQKQKKDTGKKSAEKPDPEAQRLEAVYVKLAEKLQAQLGTKVEITDTGGKGKIEISYYSPEELERILELLQPQQI